MIAVVSDDDSAVVGSIQNERLKSWKLGPFFNGTEFMIAFDLVQRILQHRFGRLSIDLLSLVERPENCAAYAVVGALGEQVRPFQSLKDDPQVLQCDLCFQGMHVKSSQHRAEFFAPDC